MGCDIHSFAEKKNAEGKWEAIDGLHPFDWRAYGMYGWLADVRNYSALTPISVPRGLPEDVSPEVTSNYEAWDMDAHTPSWLSVDELLAFDYDATCEDRRCTRVVPGGWISGGETCDAGDGRMTTYREMLGPEFFKDLQRLKDAGTERVVFWFDN